MPATVGAQPLLITESDGMEHLITATVIPRTITLTVAGNRQVTPKRDDGKPLNPLGTRQLAQVTWPPSKRALEPGGRALASRSVRSVPRGTHTMDCGAGSLRENLFAKWNEP